MKRSLFRACHWLFMVKIAPVPEAIWDCLRRRRTLRATYQALLVVIVSAVSAADVLMGATIVQPASVPAFTTFLKERSTITSLSRDSAGNIYVLGYVPESPIPGNGTDLFVAKLDPGATKTVYFVYLGGSSADYGSGLAVDATGSTYIVGFTYSSDFPLTFDSGGVRPNQQPLPFVMKLDSNGEVVYSRFLAGAIPVVFGIGSLDAYGRTINVGSPIAVSSNGCVIITGIAQSSGFPVTSGAFNVGDSKGQPFVAELDPTGAKLVFSAVGVGGGFVTLDSAGEIFVSGISPPTYPTTSGAFQTTCSGGCQYVTKLSPDGSRLIYSTFLRAAVNEGLVVDAGGNAYVTGTTNAEDYPYTGTNSSTPRPGTFLTKLDPSGNVTMSVQQGGTLIGLTTDGDIVVSGYFAVNPGPRLPSGPFLPVPPPPPTGNTPPQCLPNGLTVKSAAYIMRLNSQDGSVLSTQILTATALYPLALLSGVNGTIYLAGSTDFPDIPLTPGVVFSEEVAQRIPNGSFLALVDTASKPLAAQLSCVLDTATDAPVGPVAPGQLVSLFGNRLGPEGGVMGATAGAASVPTALSGITVTFDGTFAPLLYVSANQINAQVPFELDLQRATALMEVSVGGLVVATRMFAVTPSSPSLFVDSSSLANCPHTDTYGFLSIALNNDGSRNSCTNPASLGSWVTVFLNGVGLGGNRVTGSITGTNPMPLPVPVSLSDGSSVASGPVTPSVGSISGLDQIALRVPDSIVVFDYSGISALGLGITVGTDLSGPFFRGDQLYQRFGIVWVTR